VPISSGQVLGSGPESRNFQESFKRDEAESTLASSCSPIEPPYLNTEDKIALAPIVFQGKI